MDLKLDANASAALVAHETLNSCQMAKKNRLISRALSSVEINFAALVAERVSQMNRTTNAPKNLTVRVASITSFVVRTKATDNSRTNRV